MTFVKNHVQQIRVSSSALCELLIFFGGDRESTFFENLLVDLVDELFGNEMMLCFVFFFLLLVVVNSRPANYDSLMELGQSSTSANLLSVSRGMLETSEFLCPQIFRSVTSGLSKRKLSCEQFSSPFSLTTFTTHSSSVETGS